MLRFTSSQTFSLFIMASSDVDYLTPNPSKKPAVSELPQETLDFAAKCFDLARTGGDEMLKIYLNAGLPPNLTNSAGTQETLCLNRSY